MWFKGKRINKTPHVVNNYQLVILCGPSQLDLLYLCLKSVYKSFEKLPHIFLFADLDLNVELLKKKVEWLPAGSISIIGGADCINYHQQNQRETLATFAKKNVMGLKLAAILQILDIGKPVLYCDTDVLWFDDPYQIISQYLMQEEFEMVMSEDYQPAYDKNLIKKAALQSLQKPPYFCAGMMLVKNFSPYRINSLESLLNEAIQRSDHFTEQTIFAQLNRQSENLAFDKNKFLIKTDDQFEIKSKPLNGVIARHYIGPVRHLFWRDALWIK